MSGLVVVGVDGSASSLAAVETAAREARLRGAGLRLVHAFVWPAMHAPLGPSPLGPPEGGLQNMVDRLVAEAVERARAVAPEVEVGHVVVTGEPLTVLEAQSRAAELVVVGCRGMGGFVGLLVGSTAVHLAAHGRCPVLVVREQPLLDGPIVLGVDGSAAGQKAVDFAFSEAALRNAPLVALHTWTAWNAPMPPRRIRPCRTRTRREHWPRRRRGCCPRRSPDVGGATRASWWSTGWCTAGRGRR
ncbi:hypothetical protein SALBM217S_05526 [Streptomyces griseoloalbus]